MIIKSNISFLEEQYLKAKIAYYEGIPFLTDTEFDALELELKHEGSKVIEQVGSKRKDFNFTHPTKMLSLSKIQTEGAPKGTNYMEGEFQKWYRKRMTTLGISSQIPLLVSPKFDGNAINIIYHGTYLVNILTRGDGFTGKDITKRFSKVIPENIKLQNLEVTPEDTIEIRCEVVIKTSIFNEKYAEKFANPRNYVAGVIGMDDEDEIKISELTIIPLYYLLNGIHVEEEHFMKNVPYCRDYNTPMFAESYELIIKSHENLRKNYPFQLDGVVISFPVSYRKILGENSHDPEWAIAIKFVPVEVVTGVEGIEWNLSKRGEIIPTLLLKPVLLDGSMVRRVSAYNAGYVIKNELKPGSIISLHKSGDIIPEISKIIA